MNNDSLFGSHYVFGMHDDLDLIDELEVGFNENRELVIRLSRTCYGWVAEDFSDAKCWIEAYVSRDEAYQVATRLKVPLTELPDHIASSASDYGEHDIDITMQACWEGFNELIALLESHGARPAIRKKYAIRKNGQKYSPWH